MASKARKAFDDNVKDISRLFGIHKSIGGEDPGRRYDLEVLNKSAIILTTAFWEAYCEDLAAEGLAHLVSNTSDPDTLPSELRKQISSELKKSPHDFAPWEIAGSKWRTFVTARLERLRVQRNMNLNTPKAEQIDKLFLETIGLASISSRWYWQGMSAQNARTKLNKYVELRGSIAHRGAAESAVQLGKAKEYLGFIKRTAAKTGGGVNQFVRRETGKSLW